MPALNTTQGHPRIDTCQVIPLHRGYAHELVPHCTPEPDKLDSFDRGFVALSLIVCGTAAAWIAAGCPGLEYLGR